MERATPTSQENRLLALLPLQHRRRLIERCEPVDLVLAELLQQPDAPVRHVLFPLGSFISQLTPADGHDRMEIGLVGDEGMLGATLVLGVASAPTVALVQGAGRALRMESRLFRQEFERSDELRGILLRYIYVVTCQLAQMAVCTRFHVVQERLARWLLMTGDRAHSNEFRITHEFLATMLGVRRAGVTRAAGSLQALGLIHYHRGNIDIVDRRGLERTACVCYSADRRTYSRVLNRGGR